SLEQITADDFAAPTGRAAIEAALAGLFRIRELILELGQVGCFFEFRQAFGRVLRNKPGFTTHVDVAYALDLAGSLSLLPGLGYAVQPDFGIDVQVTALEGGQRGQSLGGQHFRLAAVTLVGNKALDFD